MQVRSSSLQQQRRVRARVSCPCRGRLENESRETAAMEIPIRGGFLMERERKKKVCPEFDRCGEQTECAAPNRAAPLQAPLSRVSHAVAVSSSWPSRTRAAASIHDSEDEVRPPLTAREDTHGEAGSGCCRETLPARKQVPPSLPHARTHGAATMLLQGQQLARLEPPKRGSREQGAGATREQEAGAGAWVREQGAGTGWLEDARGRAGRRVGAG
nr:unnamed protein product [Digitaria exilis]